jgi:hypothetical protein
MIELLNIEKKISEENPTLNLIQRNEKYINWKIYPRIIPINRRLDLETHTVNYTDDTRVIKYLGTPLAKTI